MKSVSGTLKLDLAQFRSLEAFAMFASDLDATSRAQLARGARLTELLKQGQYSPFAVEDQVASIWAGTKGKLDDVPVEDVRRFESELLDHLRRNTEVLTTIAESGKLDDATQDALAAAVDEFRNGFLKADGSPLVGAADADEDVEVEQEQIVRQKKA
jgi:F-type H+-transporting ATPase subunit alpha